MSFLKSRVLGTALAACVAAGAGCVLPPSPPAPPPDITNSPRLRDKLAEIDRLTDRMRVREAIELAELSLIDFHESSELADRIAALRSMRQVMFTRALEDAAVYSERGLPRTALAVLHEVEAYGDEEMLATASQKRGEIIMAHPAIFSEGEDAPRPAVDKDG